jgi:hypothetical protein
MSESVVLCEGFHDRAFWAGWLLDLGCTDPGHTAGGARKPIVDPWKKPVIGGQFAYHSKSGRFVRVHPCHGSGNLRREARNRVSSRALESLLRLVVNVDSDVIVGGAAAAVGWTNQTLADLAMDADNQCASISDREYSLDGGDCTLNLVRWECADVAAAGIPAQQTLERLVTASLVAAYPDRGPAVQAWLDHRPAPPGAGVKEFAWSHMAGWYADQGCEAFYSQLWNDPDIVAQLEPRLRAIHAWSVAEALAS